MTEIKEIRHGAVLDRDEFFNRFDLKPQPMRLGHIPTAKTRQIVRKLVVANASTKDICDYLGCTKNDFQKYYKTDVAHAKLKFKDMIATELMVDAMERGNTASLHLLAKSKLGGFSEPVKQQMVNEDEMGLEVNLNWLTARDITPKIP